MHFQIRGMTQGYRGQLFRIESEKPLLVGRLRTADICIDDNSVSRRHCILRRDGESLLVRDENSVNGTFVNGIRLTSDERALLHRDILQIGQAAFLVEKVDELVADVPIFVRVSEHG